MRTGGKKNKIRNREIIKTQQGIEGKEGQGTAGGVEENAEKKNVGREWKKHEKASKGVLEKVVYETLLWGKKVPKKFQNISTAYNGLEKRGGVGSNRSSFRLAKEKKSKRV